MFFQVAEMISLLEEWPKLPPDHALELLDYAYAEPAVRSYAIECLLNFRLVLKIDCQHIMSREKESVICININRF